MFISASTKHQVLNMITKLPVYNELLFKYTSDKKKFPTNDLRNEFKQYMWLILCEKPEDKIVKAWNEKYFLYSFIRTITNSLNSKTSPWAQALIKNEKYTFVSFYDTDINDDEYINNNTPEYLIDNNKTEDEILEEEYNRENNLKLIEEAKEYWIKHDPKLYGIFKLFDLNTLEDMSERAISKKMKIPNGTVHNQLHQARALIKAYIRNIKQNIKTYKQ